VRSEQTLHTNGEFDTGTWVSGEQSLPHGNVQHAPEDAKLLVYRRGLQNSFLSESEGRLDSDSLAETISQVDFYVVGSDVHQTARRESVFEVLHGT
jgi:hypothetical protein